jgi:hypothetical protein
VATAVASTAANDRTSGQPRAQPPVYQCVLSDRDPGVWFALVRGTTTFRKETHMTVRFFPNDKGNPPGKLADAELHFSGGPLDGLKLIGFAVWERKNGGRNVTFPARQYSVNGERRSFALLRPILDQTTQDRLRDLIIDAYREHEETMAEAV